MLLHIKKNYFIHLCCLLLKSSKVFSVPLRKEVLKENKKKQHLFGSGEEGKRKKKDLKKREGKVGKEI